MIKKGREKMNIANNQYTSDYTSKSDYIKSSKSFIYQLHNTNTYKKSFQLWIDNKHFANLIHNIHYNNTFANSPIYTIHPINKVTNKLMKSQGIIIIRRNTLGNKFFLMPKINPYFSCDFFIHDIYQNNNSFHLKNEKPITHLYYLSTQTKGKVANPKNKKMKGEQ